MDALYLISRVMVHVLNGRQSNPFYGNKLEKLEASKAA